MNKNDIIGVALVMSPLIIVLLLIPVVSGNESKRIVACLNAGMEWIDGDCMKGETK